MNKELNNLLREMAEVTSILKSNPLNEEFDAPQEGMDEFAAEEYPQDTEETVDVINQIRELAIQGISKYANQVESEQYQALKKIWLLTDKFYEGMNGDNNQ
jgi:hypothetical protein